MENNRIFIISFSVFAALSLVFGMIRIGQNIKLTFAADETDNESETSEQEGTGNEAALLLMDTDEDGLNDWAELNAHGTSPYLADSDSDGVNDSEEIKNGKDPNCPEGRDCSGAGSTATVSGEAGTSSPETVADFSPETEAALAALQRGETLQPDQIRSILREAGVSEADLAAATDEELLELVGDVSEEVFTLPE